MFTLFLPFLKDCQVLLLFFFVEVLLLVELMSSSPIFLSDLEILHAVPLTMYHKISKGNFCH